MAEDMIERAADAIELDNAKRLDTPFGSRRAIDKSCFEVYYLDYPDWREVIRDVTIIARYPSDEEADAHALKLQKQWAARAALLAALDLSNDKTAFQVLVTALAVADDGHPDGLKYHEQAKAALLALHDHIAQGERTVSEDQGRKD